jgi:hypothetical protein
MIRLRKLRSDRLRAAQPAEEWFVVLEHRLDSKSTPARHDRDPAALRMPHPDSSSAFDPVLRWALTANVRRF